MSVEELAPFEDLTLPRSTESARRVLSAALRDRLSNLRRLPAESRELRATLRKLADQLRVEPGPVFRALSRPTVGAMIRVLRKRPSTELATRLASTLAGELLSAGAELDGLTLDVPPGLPCLGARCLLPAGRRKLEGRRWGDVELEEDGTFLPIEHNLLLAMADSNPLAMTEAHPDKEGNAIDLGGREGAEWCDALREALGVIEKHLPVVHEELHLTVEQIVPVGYHEERHLSASYQEAIGTIYLTLHPRTMTMTEALVHEHMHNKINALFEIDPVFHNAFAPLFTSPVRPDPRPLHGILLAVHAFLPVAELYRQMRRSDDPRARSPEFEKRYAQIIEGNRAGVAVLSENADPTAHGRAILDELERLNDSFR